MSPHHPGCCLLQFEPQQEDLLCDRISTPAESDASLRLCDLPRDLFLECFLTLFCFALSSSSHGFNWVFPWLQRKWNCRETCEPNVNPAIMLPADEVLFSFHCNGNLHFLSSPLLSCEEEGSPVNSIPDAWRWAAVCFTTIRHQHTHEHRYSHTSKPATPALHFLPGSGEWTCYHSVCVYNI